MIRIYSKHIVFRDIVNCLYYSIKKLGYKTCITDIINQNSEDLYILVGAAEFFDKIPKNYIVFQFEQTNVSFKDKKDIWFTPKYIQLMKNALYVWDYSNENIHYLNYTFNIKNIVYIPLKYSLVLDNFPNIKESKKDIDILFMG